jgi:hypothetical protein
MNHLQGVSCNITQPLPKLQSSQPLLAKKQLTKQDLHKLSQQ